MDSNQAQNKQLRNAQARGQPADNRFSWQIPADSASNLQRPGRTQLNLGELTPQQIAAEKVRLQEAQRAQQEAQQRRDEGGTLLSIQSTPIEYRAPVPFGGAQRRPTEPTIPQSPVSPEDPPDAPTTLMAPHSFAIPQQTQQAPAPAPTAALPPVPQSNDVAHDVKAPRAVPPQSVSVTSEPEGSDTEKQKVLSGESAHRLSTQAPAKPYIPYAETTTAVGGSKLDAPYSPGAPTKSSPYAPDDLVHVHQQAALSQGRTPTFAPHALPADTRVHQPGQIAHPNQRGDTARRDEWGHSLFACAPDADTCCLGMVCPCIVYGRTAYRLGRRDGKSGDPTDMLGFESCNAACGIMALLGCVGCLFPMVARTRIRHAYKIEGGVGGDCLAAWCCCCCVAVQNEREVKEREESKRRFAGPGGGEGYSPPGAEMKYQPGGT